MIAVIDYKAGNLTSVVKALRYLGAETQVTQDAGGWCARRKDCAAGGWTFSGDAVAALILG